MEKMIRVLIGLAVAGGAIWYSFQPREPSKFSPKVVGGYEVSEQTTNDPLAIPLPQITQNPPKQLPTEVQKTIQDCLEQSKVPFDSQAIFAVKSLETLRGLLTTKQAPKSRTRTREAITFQTGDQMRDGLKSRAASSNSLSNSTENS
ncbi:MAG: hypothetical protein EOP05_23810 [Proteobacteria bacterium]|nr:MAG: hypothetical protein EOP05_23810 [Pseudomonadota bacterium]